MENKRILANKYVIERRIGSGGEGVAYLVKEKENIDSDKKFIAKILEFEGNEEEEEYEEDEQIEESINHKIKIFRKISLINPPSPYIIGCIEEGKGKIVRDNHVLKNRNFFIFEYAPKGDLWRITQLAGGFGERCSKLIFKKILLGVQTLHNAHIYHLDLKIDNIILDENYNPKICDFGLATDQDGLLSDYVGTINYKPPQMFENVKFTAAKADIFSLGCILLALVAKGPWFRTAERTDPLYKYIIGNQIDEFFNKLNVNGLGNLTPEFKNLYTRMIAYKEEDRPNIQQILEDAWFDEIKNLNEIQQQNLENEVKNKFIEKENDVNTILEYNPNILAQFETFISTTRAFGDETKIYFNQELCPKKKYNCIYTDNYLKMKGNFNYYKDMNLLLNKIKEEFEKQKIDCIISPSKYSYKCDLEFISEEEDDENEDEKGKMCIIQLKLYQTGDKDFSLRFLRKKGDLPQYYEKVKQIIKIAKNIF